MFTDAILDASDSSDMIVSTWFSGFIMKYPVIIKNKQILNHCFEAV